jgi:hypothetical protein
MDDTAELTVRVLTEQMERVAAAHELQALGIEPSPADVSAWLAADTRTKRRLGIAWAVLRPEIDPERGNA